MGLDSFLKNELFWDRVDLWSNTRATPTAAAPNPQPAWTREASDVSCHLHRNPSVSQLEMYGRVEQDDIFTLDLFLFDIEQAVDEGWAVVVKTSGRDYGECWITRGGPRVMRGVPGVPCDHVGIVASKDTLPSGVTL